MKILFVIHPFHEAPYKYRESNGITLTTLKKILEKRGHEVEIFETRNNFPTKKGDYDIIHGFSNSAIRVLRTKYLGFMNSAAKVHSMRGISSSRIGGLRFSEFFRFVDHLIVPSEDIKKKIAGKRLNTPIDVIPSSIDTSKFQPLKVEKFKIPTLLYYGKVFDKTDSRGIKNIIDTAKKMPTIDFLIMPRGDKNIDKLDKNYLKKINKSDNIKILRAE